MNSWEDAIQTLLRCSLLNLLQMNSNPSCIISPCCSLRWNQRIIHHLSSKGCFQNLQLYWHFCSQYKCHGSSGSDNEMWCGLFAWVFKGIWWLLFSKPYPSFCTSLTATREGNTGHSYPLSKAYALCRTESQIQYDSFLINLEYTRLCDFWVFWGSFYALLKRIQKSSCWV